jgi:hypothetical protein
VPQHPSGDSQVTARTRTQQGTRLETADGTEVICAEVPDTLGEVRAVAPLWHGLGNAATGGTWRVLGTTASALLKVARLPAYPDPAKAFPTGDEPTHWNYWRRESLAYQTDLAATAYASAGIAVPALLAAGPRADGGPQQVLGAAQAGARTLCHLDVWPANLIDDAGTSVLFDWSFVGEGAVGEDAANLILDSCSDGLMDASLLPEIAASVTDGYLRGLRDAGWPGSADSARAAIAACGAAKYSWFGPWWVSRVVRDDLGPSSYGQDHSAAAGSTG